MLLREKALLWLKISALLLIPVALLALPADFFDEGESLCPSKRFFNVECLGCGMTRAIMHLLHLDIEMALYYNPGSLALGPALGVVWLVWIFRLLKRLREK